MRACECECTTPPHRYFEDDNGTTWMETIGESPCVWTVASCTWDDLYKFPTIDPEPVWAEIVAAQLKGQVSE